MPSTITVKATYPLLRHLEHACDDKEQKTAPGLAVTVRLQRQEVLQGFPAHTVTQQQKHICQHTYTPTHAHMCMHARARACAHTHPHRPCSDCLTAVTRSTPGCPGTHCHTTTSKTHLSAHTHTHTHTQTHTHTHTQRKRAAGKHNKTSSQYAKETRNNS